MKKITNVIKRSALSLSHHLLKRIVIISKYSLLLGPLQRINWMLTWKIPIELNAKFQMLVRFWNCYQFDAMMYSPMIKHVEHKTLSMGVLDPRITSTVFYAAINPHIHVVVYDSVNINQMQSNGKMPIRIPYARPWIYWAHFPNHLPSCNDLTVGYFQLLNSFSYLKFGPSRHY